MPAITVYDDQLGNLEWELPAVIAGDLELMTPDARKEVLDLITLHFRGYVSILTAAVNSGAFMKPLLDILGGKVAEAADDMTVVLGSAART